MEILLGLTAVLVSAGVPVWFIVDLKKDVVTIRDNHLKHIAEDITDLKVKVAVLEEKK